MRNYKGLLFILLPAVVLAVLSSSYQPPLSIFLLKGSENDPEAFRIGFFLERRDPLVESLKLNPRQRREAGVILGQRDEAGLAAFAKDFGRFPVVIGSSLEEGWPSCLGGGWRALGQKETFDNLTWPDRLYLGLKGRIPPPAPFLAGDVPIDDLSSFLPPAKGVTPGATPSDPAVKTGTLRVEILNGCGIKGAADWAARRVRGPGILIAGMDNADNFRHPKTIVKTSAGIPVALEEALSRLGLSKSCVEEAVSLSSTASKRSGPSSPVDVIVIVGRDFSSLKRLERERNRH